MSIAPRTAACSVTVESIRHRLDTRTKPQGSLGALETLGVQIGLALGTERPVFNRPHIMVFAADHGIAADGVSAFPREVTAQMVDNYLAGGAAINVLARQHGIALDVVDAGVARELEPRAGLELRGIAPGTRNFRFEPAMTAAQRDQAIEAGRTLAAQAIAAGANALLLGEMGIGNTAAAALLLHRLTGWPLASCVGRGTGLDDAGLAHKQGMLEAAAARCPAALGPLETLAEFGGFEIAMLSGALFEVAQHPCVAVIDGFTVSVAALIAQAVEPEVLPHCIFSHCSAERGHRALLEHLAVRPVLDLGLRLGEASGAALAWPLIDAAARLLTEMASFDAAGVADRSHA